jgi:hypothetical protein
LIATPLFAATIHGTVFGPDGPVANAKVIANQCRGQPEPYSADAEGNFSIDFPDIVLDCLQAEPPSEEMGLIGESIDWVDATSNRTVNLFLAPLVSISGQVVVPDGYEGFVQLEGQRLDKVAGGCWPGLDENNEFEIDCAAGMYAFRVTGSCEWFLDPVEIYVCPFADWFGSTGVDASEGSVDGVEILLEKPGKYLTDQRAPIASLITVGEADEGGIATVSGAPGAVPGPAMVGIVNLGTGHWTQGGAQADGSFDIPFLAPPGSWLEIRQDPSGLAWSGENPRATGTIIQVPPSGNGPNAFAILGRAFEWSESVTASGDIASLGVKDTGQIWISGELASRQWNPGEQRTLNGELRIYSRNAEALDTEAVQGEVVIVLERVFAPDGKQEFSNPVFMSHYLTPTGMPIERRGGIGWSGSHHGVEIGRIQVSGLVPSGPNHLSGPWASTVEIPENLPDGVYSLALESYVENVERNDVHFEGAFPQIFDTPFTRGHATLIQVGNPDAGRLSWVLGLNDFSNGARGTVAAEDRDRIGIAGRITANSKPFFIPMKNPETGQPIPYRLEPHVPLLGASNRGWITPPTVPLDFPSGNLQVDIEQPDGTVRRLGSAPFTQHYLFTPSSKSGQGLTPASNAPRQYYGLTTLDPRFEVEFSQYGRHVITMKGSVDDAWGGSHAGGGTYEIWVAKHLDLETGVFANTPFEVGDSFSPTVIVQPGVSADVEVTISHYPQSDPEQLVTHVMKGTANRFGYFHQNTGGPFTFDAPGEYRVDVVARYWDADGVLWMGAETWASVVETPNSPVITHGLRNSCGERGKEQWLIDSETDICGGHLPFPYHTGDIAWSVDTNFDPFFTAMVPIITVQDSQGDFADVFRERGIARGLHDFNLDEEISTGEMRLFSSRPDRLPPTYFPDAPDTHWSYAYSGAARPGVRIRDMVTELENQESYWRFEDTYNYQPGNGYNGDNPNDFKFQFGGAVYRAPDLDFFYYGGYGSLWVMLPNDDSIGTRVMPPFQGNGGGPSGGPIMTLKGREIDMFLHPMGVRPGSILEVGDTASFSGQVAPTLESQVWMRVVSPSGVERTLTGNSNKFGYFYDPASDFVVDEPGVWTVRAATIFRGRTSAGQVTEPYPEGGILGADNGRYYFYVVEPESQALQVDIPGHAWVKPGTGPIDIPLLPTDDLTDVSVHRTTVMPGFMMEAGETQNTTYTYDAVALQKDFPNLDLVDQDMKFGADTVTMNFLVTGKDGGGNTVHRARQVLLQGEELMAPEQAPTFSINAGLNDAWVNAEAANQGMFVTVFPSIDLMFAAWFTFDSAAPPGAATATLGAPDQRWITALGPYSGTSAMLNAELTTGGRFNTSDPIPSQDTGYGTIAMEFEHCNQVNIDYDFPGVGESGSMVMTRAVGSNVGLCNDISAGTVVPTAFSNTQQVQRLSNLIKGAKPEAESATFMINAGLNDAWVNQEALYQGIFLTVFPDLQLMFAAWFTFDSQASGNQATLGGPDQRWLTALGSYSGTSASLKVENTTGGLFNALNPTPTQDTDYGTLDIDFADCNNLTVTFDLPGAGESGQFNMSRALNDNVGLCEVLSAQ